MSLGWVSYCTGFLDLNELGQPTTIAPDGLLLQRFSEAKPHWKQVSFTGDPIVVRIKNKATGTRRVIDPPDTPEVHLMRQHMQQINDFLCDQVWPPEPTCRDLAGLEILMGFWLQAPFSQPIQV